MIPPSVAAAVAPVLLDKFLDKVVGGAASPAAVTAPTAEETKENIRAYARGVEPLHPIPTAPPGPMDAVVGMAREYFDHEKSKAKVRPAVMKMSGLFTIFASVCYVAAAVAPMFSEVSHEDSTHAMDALIWAMGGGASFYGYKHTVRSVDKWKGTS